MSGKRATARTHVEVAHRQRLPGHSATGLAWLRRARTPTLGGHQVSSKRPSTSSRQRPPDLGTRVSILKAPPTPLQRLAWQRLWPLLLQGDPATPAPDEPLPDVADARGARTHADDQA